MTNTFIEQKTSNDAEMNGSDRAVALNRVIWKLSEALGLVPYGAQKISIEISDVVGAACEEIKKARTLG